MADQSETFYGITQYPDERRGRGSIFIGRPLNVRVDTAEIQRALHAGITSPSRRESDFSAFGTPEIDTVTYILGTVGIGIDLQSPGGQRFTGFMSRRLGSGPPITRDNYAEFFRQFLDQEFLPANGHPRQRSSLDLNPVA